MIPLQKRIELFKIAQIDKLSAPVLNSSIVQIATPLWDAGKIAVFYQIFSILNTAIFFSSNGKTNLNTLKLNNFSYDPSQFSDTTTRYCIEYSKWLYTTINQKPKDPKIVISTIKTSPLFAKLPSGGINELLSKKLNGSLKDLLQSQMNKL